MNQDMAKLRAEREALVEGRAHDELDGTLQVKARESESCARVRGRPRTGGRGREGQGGAGGGGGGSGARYDEAERESVCVGPR